MKNVEIVYASISNLRKFHETLDKVAREKIYLEQTKAKPFNEVFSFQINLIKNNYPVFFAIEDNKVVGWIDITPNQNPRMNHRAELGMGLLPTHRGLGIGSRLLETALNHARQMNLEKVELSVYTSNLAAIHLYKKFHFQETGIIKNFRKLDDTYFDIVQMELFLK